MFLFFKFSSTTVRNFFERFTPRILHPTSTSLSLFVMDIYSVGNNRFEEGTKDSPKKLWGVL